MKIAFKNGLLLADFVRLPVGENLAKYKAGAIYLRGKVAGKIKRVSSFMTGKIEFSVSVGKVNLRG